MNAIIMAAGTSSRFTPLSYEVPKGLLKVRGEILIERQIRQLQEAGITDIIIVVGYMAEKLMYLKEKYDVRIVYNEDYNRYNNTSSIIRVVEELGDTYICSSDNYFPINVFQEKSQKGFYSALYTEGSTNEYCITVDHDDNIIDVKVGGNNAWYMVGHVYFDMEFSKQFREILKKEYDKTETKLGYWEDLYIKHLMDLPPLKIHKYKPHDIEEFDTLDELRLFDETYVNHTGCQVLQNICTILKCKESDIHGIIVLKKGMTNSSFVFTCKMDHQKYVYRHPGIGTESLINRDNELFSLQVAKEYGFDETFIYMHPTDGWKISHYIENAETLNNKTIQLHDNLDKIATIYHSLHNSGVLLKQKFDIFQEIDKYDKVIEEIGATMYNGWEGVYYQIMDLKTKFEIVDNNLCPCHNDAVAANFIKDKKGKLYLIDWEYAGMNDPMADFAALFLENDFSTYNKDYILTEYFNGVIPDRTNERILYFQILWDYLWSQWTIIKEAKGDDFGSYGEDRFNRCVKNLENLKKL